jgi:hypothetical protein
MAAPLYTPAVFISHSAKNEAEAMALCQAIAARLTQGKFEVLWDKNLETSQGWRAGIDEWIWRCDAAVLVLSRDAVDSRYVAYEAALLRQRWLARRPAFALVPVWCPPVDNQLLVQKMGALQIAEIHTDVKLASWPANAVADPATAFASELELVADALKEVAGQSHPRHEIEDLLITEFEQGTQSDSALSAIANAYQLPALPAGAHRDRAVLLARLLLDSSLKIGYDRFARLMSGIPKMKATVESSKDRVFRIVKLVAPFCWVSADSAGRIPEFVMQPPAGVRTMGWTRAWNFSERMYLHRAFCSRYGLHIVDVSDRSGGGTQAIFQHITRCLADRLCNNPNATVAAVDKRIKRSVADGRPVFLVLPADGLDEASVKLVQGEWPQLCIFLYSDTMTDPQMLAQFPDIRLIEPPLRRDDEDDARAGWGDCLQAAGWFQQRDNLEEFDS